MKILSPGKKEGPHWPGVKPRSPDPGVLNPKPNSTKDQPLRWARTPNLTPKAKSSLAGVVEKPGEELQFFFLPFLLEIVKPGVSESLC
ncbi:hypothetical protein AVEN_232020-1 [Araneus ventricosus]|uniref:Uncharacterized protein n=1 Tax=Araneus ventricosus TaxID=182803 RepID=A0A4Y2MYE6_ARAVE|nr:hypothetical protein AVEN_232020-1 [Araneus ventricosus]